MNKSTKKPMVTALFMVATMVSQAGIIRNDDIGATVAPPVILDGLSSSVFRPVGGFRISGARMEQPLPVNGQSAFIRHPGIPDDNVDAVAQNDDRLDIFTFFNVTNDPVFTPTESNQADMYNDVLELLLDTGDGLSLYGWATDFFDAGGSASSPGISILRTTVSNTANQSIAIGSTNQSTIPEPTAVTLVVGSGIALIGARRFFRK